MCPWHSFSASPLKPEQARSCLWQHQAYDRGQRWHVTDGGPPGHVPYALSVLPEHSFLCFCFRGMKWNMAGTVQPSLFCINKKSPFMKSDSVQHQSGADRLSRPGQAPSSISLCLSTSVLWVFLSQKQNSGRSLPQIQASGCFSVSGLCEH